VLTLAVVAVLLALLPGALLRIAKSGDLYLFTEWFFHDLIARLSGPGKLRFVNQPLVAIALGVHGGSKDASAGKPPFLSAVFFFENTEKNYCGTHSGPSATCWRSRLLLTFFHSFFFSLRYAPGLLWWWDRC
jgi:hypothetical protein